MKNLDTHELAWCAGFFDGEGSTFMQLQPNGSYVDVHITLDVSQKNPLLLRRFNKAIHGYGKFHRGSLRTAKFEHVQYVICLLWKWLGSIKKEQYKKAIRKYLENCWKPKFNKISIYRREYHKYGSKTMIMRNKIKLYNMSTNDRPFINPFEKVS